MLPVRPNLVSSAHPTSEDQGDPPPNSSACFRIAVAEFLLDGACRCVVDVVGADECGDTRTIATKWGPMMP